jgi:hypothetical protein
VVGTRERPHLLLEPRQRDLVADARGRQHLQRDDARDAALVAEVDRAHAALTELSDEVELAEAPRALRERDLRLGVGGRARRGERGGAGLGEIAAEDPGEDRAVVPQEPGRHERLAADVVEVLDPRPGTRAVQEDDARLRRRRLAHEQRVEVEEAVAASEVDVAGRERRGRGVARTGELLSDRVGAHEVPEFVGPAPARPLRQLRDEDERARRPDVGPLEELRRRVEEFVGHLGVEGLVAERPVADDLVAVGREPLEEVEDADALALRRRDAPDATRHRAQRAARGREVVASLEEVRRDRAELRDRERRAPREVARDPLQELRPVAERGEGQSAQQLVDRGLAAAGVEVRGDLDRGRALEHRLAEVEGVAVALEARLRVERAAVQPRQRQRESVADLGPKPHGRALPPAAALDRTRPRGA